MARGTVKSRRIGAKGWLAAAAVGLSVLACGQARAFEFWENTHLIDLRAGEGLSESIRSLRYGGYELSDGSFQSFSGWYRSDWRDLHVTFMTQVS